MKGGTYKHVPRGLAVGCRGPGWEARRTGSWRWRRGTTQGPALTGSPSLRSPPRLFFRRHYPLTTLRFCGMDPEQQK